jgi:hypothetical protein
VRRLLAVLAAGTLASVVAASFEDAERPGDARVREREDRQHHIARPRLDGSEERLGGRLDPGVDGIQGVQGRLGGPHGHGQPPPSGQVRGEYTERGWVLCRRRPDSA